MGVPWRARSLRQADGCNQCPGSGYNQTDIGPSRTIPVAGDYLIGIGSNGYTLATVNQDVYMSYDIGATAAVDADAANANLAAGAGPGRGNYHRLRRKTVTAAAAALETRYRITAQAPVW